MMASVPAVIGWLMLGFVVLLVGMSADVACTARRGDAYQDCVRGDDLAALRVQATIMGLSLVSFVPILCQLIRRGSTSRLDTWTKTAAIVSSSLVAVSVVGWIFGVTGLWAPDRPLPYEPVSVASGSIIMLQGALVGFLVGLVICATIASGGRHEHLHADESAPMS